MRGVRALPPQGVGGSYHDGEVVEADDLHLPLRVDVYVDGFGFVHFTLQHHFSHGSQARERPPAVADAEVLLFGRRLRGAVDVGVQGQPFPCLGAQADCQHDDRQEEHCREGEKTACGTVSGECGIDGESAAEEGTDAGYRNAGKQEYLDSQQEDTEDYKDDDECHGYCVV